jgi:hypothetical protein
MTRLAALGISQVLGIQGCPLAGKISLWLSTVHSLEVLVLSHNHLTGSISDCIKDVSYIFYVDVSNNSLTGEIPTTLTDMPMSETVHLNHTAFELTRMHGQSLQ